MLDLSTIDRLFQAVPGFYLVYRLDADLTIVAASADFLKTTRSDVSIYGRPLFDVFPDNPMLADADGTQNLRAAIERVKKSKAADRMEAQRYDLPLPQSFGGGFEERYWNISITPLLDAEGEIEYLINHAEEASAKHQRDAIQILESITEGFFTLDRAWRFDYVNREAHRILDRAVGDLAGKVLWEVYPGLEGTDFEKSYHRTMYEREKASFVAFYPNQQRWYDVTTFPAPEGISVYFRNVTEQKEIEAEREAASQALREQARRLEQADIAKDEFLATLSHELRNPLAPLRTAVEVLKRTGNTDVRSLRLQAMMERQITHMVRLMDDLLEMSRISRGTLSLQKERVDLASVVTSAVEATESLMKSSGHAFTVTLAEGPVFLDGDPVRLVQIVTNLLNNAAKYTEDGGTVALEVKVEDGHALVVVQDDGVGITQELQPRLFEMFSRGDRLSARHQGGLGIGLAISQRLAQMHGGSVTMFSAGAGQGSRFTVHLPIVDAPSPADMDMVDTPLGTSVPTLNILLVDDNVDAADALAEVLELPSLDVRVAYSGQQGLDLLAGWKPDVALLDIGMPGMNGYELARAIRSRYGDATPTLVAVTGWGQESDRAQAREAGFDHHFLKPVDVEKLERLVHSLFPGVSAASF